ncbi:hypothetical protein DPMN_162900 [Dreissena polymorpha]|uniref:Uncharacterized protein n=1 Tax=Dreissena polymorpha TaxID=45954 RepID=A0A9D4ESA6_DREPO|nr:hypothetical protein DPMN_162900 [Dreissena polymorpha]
MPSMCCFPTKEKGMYRSLKQLKKTAGPDSIPTETLKPDVETSMGLLHSKDMRRRHTDSVEKRSYQAPRELRPHVLLQIPRN